MLRDVDLLAVLGFPGPHATRHDAAVHMATWVFWQSVRNVATNTMSLVCLTGMTQIYLDL